MTRLDIGLLRENWEEGRDCPLFLSVLSPMAAGFIVIVCGRQFTGDIFSVKISLHGDNSAARYAYTRLRLCI